MNIRFLPFSSYFVIVSLTPRPVLSINVLVLTLLCSAQESTLSVKEPVAFIMAFAVPQALGSFFVSSLYILLNRLIRSVKLQVIFSQNSRIIVTVSSTEVVHASVNIPKIPSCSNFWIKKSICVLIAGLMFFF